MGLDLSPGDLDGSYGSGLSEGESFRVWSKHQGRLPLYARMDGSVRYRFQRGKFGIEPYLSVANLSNRRNSGGTRYPVPPQIPLLPFIGIDFEF